MEYLLLSFQGTFLVLLGYTILVKYRKKKKAPLRAIKEDTMICKRNYPVGCDCPLCLRPTTLLEYKKGNVDLLSQVVNLKIQIENQRETINKLEKALLLQQAVRRGPYE